MSKPEISLILASTSSFKQSLLKRLGLPFTVVDPQIDETPIPKENAKTLAQRLSLAKAQAGAQCALAHAQTPHHSTGSKAIASYTVIGCDQVPVTEEGNILHKPGTPERAKAELLRLSGKKVTFYTAVSVIHWRGTEPDLKASEISTHTDTTQVQYRKLTEPGITRYLAQEAAWHCAGAFQSEAMGITLLETINTTDPSALIGLPLIGLTSLLKALDFEIP